MILPKHDYIGDYKFEMQVRFMQIMSYLWTNDSCECGTPRRNISNPEHRKLMEENNWSPAGKGPLFKYDFLNSLLKVTYWCHGCNEDKSYNVRHTDPGIVLGMYNLFKEHNPEFLDELFEVKENDR